MKARPVAPLSTVRVVMVGGAKLTVIVSVFVPEPLPLVAPMVTGNVPRTDGVPVIAPVLVLIDNPAGSPVALKLVGVLVEVMV